jgi:hypothetical protein
MPHLSIDVIINLIIAVGTLGTAIAAWRAAVANQAAARGQVLAQFIGEYASAEMRETLREIALLLREHPTEFLSHYRACYTVDEAQFQRLENARRKLHWYIKSAFILVDIGVWNWKVLETAIVNTNGYRLWLTVALPLTRELPELLDLPEDLEWADRLARRFPTRAEPPSIPPGVEENH